MDTPRQLIHYTTINTLSLILKTQSINFNRLDKVNDRREGLSADFGSFAQYLFVSCWTETYEENLAFWNMYTPKMRGIRIELPLPIFEEYAIGKNSGCLVSIENLVDETKGIFVIPHFYTVYKIKYTDDENLLQPKIIVPIENDMGYKLDGVGVYKKTIWSIENEWRYRVNIFPIDKNNKSDDFRDRYSDLVDKKYPPSISNYFIKIKESSFHKMKIILGPKAEPGDFEIVASLIKEYNPLATLEFSSLSQEIR